MPQGQGQEERRIAGDDGEDVDDEPGVVAENRDERVNGRIEDGGLHVGQNERENRRRTCRHEKVPAPVNGLENDCEKDDPKGHPDHGLVHIGDRRAA